MTDQLAIKYNKATTPKCDQAHVEDDGKLPDPPVTASCKSLPVFAMTLLNITRVTGATVTSVSRSGSKPDKWAAGQSWVDKVSWTKGDPTAGDLSSVFGQASAVISCVGVIGGSDEEMEKGNGDVNVQAAMQAAKGKTGRFVYVSVSHLVPEAFGGAVFKGWVLVATYLFDRYPQGASFVVVVRRVGQGLTAASTAESNRPSRRRAGCLRRNERIAYRRPTSARRG